MARPVLALVAVLAGCVAEPPPVQPPGQPPVQPPGQLPGPDACGASGMQGLIGRDRRVLAAMTLPQGTRVIEPGQPVTTDYSSQRLNIDLDARGRIVRLWCG